VLGNSPVNIFPLTTKIGHPLLGNLSANTSGQQLRISVAERRKHVSRRYAVLSVCSVHGPCQRVIGDNEGRLQSVVEREAEYRDRGGQGRRVQLKIDCELL
jgi:hypothetical protein